MYFPPPYLSSFPSYPFPALLSLLICFPWISCPGPQKLRVLLQWDLELQLQGLDLDLLLGTLLMYLLMVQD